jgi:class 3 adenylate cyclase
VEVDAALDANVAVAFTVSATVRPLALNPWTDLWTYMRYHTFSAYVPSPTVRAYLSTRPSAFAAVDAQGQGVLEVDTTGETELFVGSVEGGRFMTVPVRPGGPLTASLALGPGSLGLDVLELGPGKVRLTVQNPLPVRAGVLAMARSPEAFMAALAGGRARFLPYVTARDILSNPRFREVYRVQELPADLQLRIKSLTLLFTDLSGSTALYDSTGDVTAFDIVREHFALLTDCVRRHQGAVVKTMGDAVMASFVHPRDAVAAAREMLEVMAPVTARAAKFGHPVGLKVGIHEGSALVVNAESRLDYFGQTVNVAARVQGLAGPGEVWVTRPVFSAAGEGLTGAGFTADVRQVPLKGVEGLVDVVACARA